MAEVIAISLEVDAGKSVKSVKSLEDAIADVQKTTNKSNVKEKFESLNRTIDESGASFDQLNASLNAYKNIALQAGRESAIGKEALKKAGEYKLKIDEIEMEVSNLAVKGQNMQGALQIGTSVMAGYQGFLGITALVGDENEALMETMVKLQAVMSVTQAIEQIRLSTEKQSLAMKTLSNAKTKIATGLQLLYNGAIAVGTKALKKMNLALIATGFGALVVLLGVIIAKWDDWKDSILKIIRVAFWPFIKILESLGVIDDETERIRKKNHNAYIKRIKKEGDELKQVQDIQVDNLKHEISLAKARGENTEELEKKLMQITANGAQERIQINNKEIDELNKASKEGSQERIEQLEEENKENNSIIKQTIREAELFKANATQEQREAWLKARDKRIAENDEANAKEIEAQKEKDALLLELQNDLEDIIIENERDKDVRELAQLELKQQRELDALVLKYGLETELEKELLINQDNEMNELIDSIELTNKEKADAKALKEKEERDNLKKQNDKDSADRIKQESDEADSIIGFKQDILKSSVQAFGQLAGLLSKNEKLQKAAALADIATGTAIGFINALDIAQKSAKATGPAAAFAMPVFYASQIVAVLSAASKAKNLLGGGGSSITPPTISTPSFDTSTINSRSTSGDGSGDGGNTIPTNRVVLVESDLRMMQERRNNSEIISTI